MPTELDTAIVELQVLSDELNKEGRGIFDAARNTDLAKLTNILLRIIRGLQSK